MREYIIDLGNSSTGQIGCCAYVKAKSRKQALSQFLNYVGWDNNNIQSNDPNIKEIRVYFNPKNITLANVSLSE